MELQELQKKDQEEKDSRNSTTKVRDLILNQDIELGYDEEFNGFVKRRVQEHYEVYPLQSRQFHDFVYELYDDTFNSVLAKSIYESVLESLSARARIKGEQQTMALRTAKYENTVYLNLCDDGWNIIEIDKDGWRIVKDCPIWFYRKDDMDRLPTPKMTKERDIELLKKYVNYEKEADFDLMVSFLLSCFMFRTSRPILILQGGAGVGKSFTSEILRSVVDPARNKKSISRAKPTTDSIAIDVSHQAVLVYDNFSSGAVTAEVSDMFCTIATNQTYSKRALYTNNDEVIVRLGRPVIINGIDDLAKRQDLLDRSIVLDLPHLESRQTEEELRTSFKDDLPAILGHLLNCIVDSLKHAGKSDYNESRMSDFGQMVENAHTALKWHEGYFRGIYQDNRQKATFATIETNPFIQGIIELMKNKEKRRFKKTDLIEEIKSLETYDRYDTQKGVIPTARKVSERLRRDSPLLKTAGISYEEKTLDGRLIVEFTNSYFQVG